VTPSTFNLTSIANQDVDGLIGAKPVVAQRGAGLQARAHIFELVGADRGRKACTVGGLRGFRGQLT
jgi:hypothetical protein